MPTSTDCTDAAQIYFTKQQLCKLQTEMPISLSFSASWPSRPGPGMKVKAMTAKMDDVFSGL